MKKKKVKSYVISEHLFIRDSLLELLCQSKLHLTKTKEIMEDKMNEQIQHKNSKQSKQIISG